MRRRCIFMSRGRRSLTAQASISARHVTYRSATAKMAACERLDAAIGFWKEFDSGQLQKDLSSLAESIADRLHDSEESRNRLIEQTREFKKNSTEEIRSVVAPLLRGFQAEIDAAAKRTKVADGAFLAIYKKLVHMPVMPPVLEHSQQTLASLRKLEAENSELRTTIEMNEREAKAQEIVLTNLREKLVENEANVARTIQSRIVETQRELETQFDCRVQQLKTFQDSVVERLAVAEQRSAALQFALTAALSELAQLKGIKTGADVNTCFSPVVSRSTPVQLSAPPTPVLPFFLGAATQPFPGSLTNGCTVPDDLTMLSCRTPAATVDSSVDVEKLPQRRVLQADDVVASAALLNLSMSCGLMSDFPAASPSSLGLQVAPLCLSSRPPVKTETTAEIVDPASSPLDTTEIANLVRHILVTRNVGQRQFARGVLGLSQGTVSELLAKPKPWDRLSDKGRESYRRMYEWALTQTGDGQQTNDWAETSPSHNNDSNGAVSSSSYRHDNSAVTELRVAQILSEARAAMKAAEDGATLIKPSISETTSKLDDVAMQQTAGYDGSEPTTQPALNNNNCSEALAAVGGDGDCGLRPAVASETDPRDIVVRIYREELLKLAAAAKASGNAAEFATYEHQLERLATSSALPSAQIDIGTATPPQPAANLSRRRRKGHSKKAAAKDLKVMPMISPCVDISNHYVAEQIQNRSLDFPEDLSVSRSVSRDTELSDITAQTPEAPLNLFMMSREIPERCSIERVTSSVENPTVIAASSEFPMKSEDPEIPYDDESKSDDQSPLDLMQTIADSIAGKTGKKCSPAEVSRRSLPPITSEQLKRCSNLNTDEVVAAVRATLADYSISQRLFGEAVLGLSQGSVSDLLARPKPWPLLTSKGREPFVRMRIFLDDPEGTVRRLVTTQYKVPAEKLLRCGEAAETDATPPSIARKRKNSVDSSTSDTTNTSTVDAQRKPKQPRVNFTSEQKDALRRAYDADPYPTQPSIDRLAADLGIGSRTVVNWFHNHRMRYAKQQYAATGIWSVVMTTKSEPATSSDFDPSSQEFWDMSPSTVDQSTPATKDPSSSEIPSVEIPRTGCDDDDGNSGPYNSISLSAGAFAAMLQAAGGGGANRRKSARPQRLGALDGTPEKPDEKPGENPEMTLEVKSEADIDPTPSDCRKIAMTTDIAVT